jgi:hypothetical protein
VNAIMKGDDARRTAISRRTALGDIGIGIGGVALAGLLGGAARATAGAHPLAARPPHFAARAKSVILLFASGGVSHVDCFDPKPVLNTHSGQAVPEDLVKGQRFAFISGRPKLLGSPFAFRRHGACGMELSDLLPHLAAVADDTTLVRSVQTDNVNHTPAQLLFGTGHQLAGRPSLGAWTTYGLGAETADLPAFVLLSSGKLSGISMLHGAGFLPSVYQGVTFQAGATPIFHLSDPPGVTRADREATVRAINAVNAVRLTDVADPEIATRIAQYEVAFRMQAAAPELVDFSQESRATLDQYGVEPGKPSLATNLLLARRMVERGVRFVQLRDGDWDHHGAIATNLKAKCADVDRPLAALVSDLKQRGLLDETLVIWAGEFGRTPMAQGDGRDHHKEAFTVWMAGGGLRGGLSYGATDELGYRVVEDAVHVHDLQATILHLLGLDHERLTFRYQGREFRLTDVHGRVVHDLLA